MGDILSFGASRSIPVAVGKTRRSNQVENVHFTWGALGRRLNQPTRTTETMREYQAMSPDSQAEIKDVGYFVGGHFAGKKRHKSRLHERELGCLDIDYAGSDWADFIDLAYDESFAYIIHSTHKHRPDAPRLRMIFPLSRAVNEIEYEAVGRQIAARWDMDVFDATGFEFSRCMFWPSIPRDAEYVFLESTGPVLDIDTVLARYKDYRDMAQWPLTKKEHETPRAHAKKAGNPLEKKGWVGAFCRVYDIYEALEKFIPDTYLPGESAVRFTYKDSTTTNGAKVYDNGLFLYSHHDHDPIRGQSVNSFDLVRLHKFGHLDKDPKQPIQERRSYKKMLQLAKEDRAVANQHREDDREEFEEFDDDDLGLDPPGLDEKTAKKGSEKQKEVLSGTLHTDKEGHVIKNSLFNVMWYLEHEKKLTGCIQYNQFTDQLIQMKSLPGLKLPLPAMWSTDAELAIKAYLNRAAHIELCFNTHLITEACRVVGHWRTVNPPREWIESLRWDGVERLETFFIDHLGAEDDPAGYTRAVTRKWFCQGIARILWPGCHADFMLVIEGPEGIGKSRLFRALANGWFTDSLSLGLDDQRIVERTRNTWIVEIPEMITRREAGHADTKTFISRPSERVRLPYEAHAKEYPRQFILAGTTNEGDYLQGSTGNRRIWPIRSDGRQINIQAVKAIVGQLWAEAKDLLCTWEEPLHIESLEVLKVAQAVQSDRLEQDEWSGPILEWLEGTEDNGLDEPTQRNKVCVLQVWEECLKRLVGDITRRDSLRIGAILRTAKGWKATNKTMRFEVYGPAKGYARIKRSSE